MDRVTRRVPALFLAAALFPLLAWGSDWPARLNARLDHCPVWSCDLVRHFLPQASLLSTSPGTLGRGWLYPPLFALLLRPFAAMPEAWAVAVWTGLNAAAAICLAMLAPRRGLGLALVASSLPVWHALKWGQPSLLLVLGCAWGLSRGGAWGACSWAWRLRSSFNQPMH
jgi:hypothetical protein